MAKDNLIGRTLGDYKILRVLGRGGMGVVYRAEQVSIHRAVALKVLAPNLAHERTLVKRFLREGRIAAKIEHANVATVYDVGEEEGIHFILMEYVRGKTLAQVIAEEGRLEILRSLRVAEEIANALSAAHKLGIIHRDIKPDNIMLGTNRELKVMDFGLARAQSSNTNLTVTGDTLGTPRYMSPEQVRNDELTPQSDLYSLAVILFEMLTGKVPYTADSSFGLMMKTVKEPFPAIRKYHRAIPKRIERLVKKLAEKHPGDRYESADVLAAELKKLQIELANESFDKS